MGQVYDPQLKRLVTAEEAAALNQQRRAEMTPAVSHGGDGAAPPMTATIDPNADHGFLGIEGPGADQKIGITMPPLAQEDAASILNTFPQLAGLIAQFVPGGKLASFMVPATVAMGQQALEGESIDPLDALIEGIQSFAANRVGAGVASVGKGGKEWVKRSLALKGADKTDAAIAELPELAIREGQPMTKEGAEAIRQSGTRYVAPNVKVTSKNHSKLADAMDSARLDDETAPSRLTLWPQEATANYFRRAPRQFRIGQFMANPVGGVRTDTHIAPAVEAMMRLKLMQMASQEEPPLHSSRGPVRRPLR